MSGGQGYGTTKGVNNVGIGQGGQMGYGGAPFQPPGDVTTNQGMGYGVYMPGQELGLGAGGPAPMGPTNGASPNGPRLPPIIPGSAGGGTRMAPLQVPGRGDVSAGGGMPGYQPAGLFGRGDVSAQAAPAQGYTPGYSGMVAAGQPGGMADYGTNSYSAPMRAEGTGGWRQGLTSQQVARQMVQPWVDRQARATHNGNMGNSAGLPVQSGSPYSQANGYTGINPGNFRR